MKTNKAGWYYIASYGFFGGFFWSDETPSQAEQQSWGPFRTFSEARKDAIAYFQADVTAARLAIHDIRQCERPSAYPYRSKPANKLG